MASGRQDYWYGMLPGRVAVGAGQSVWHKQNNLSFSPNQQKKCGEYTVPEGYILDLTGGSVGSLNPGGHMVTLTVDEIAIMYVYFDTFHQLPFSGGGIYQVNEGETLAIWMWNRDTEINTMVYTLMGVLRRK